VLFANFAEAMAEGRGKAQAAALRKARQDVLACGVARSPSAARRADVVGDPVVAAARQATWCSSRPAS
jgi:K+-transporting ATPase ATPase B chain